MNIDFFSSNFKKIIAILNFFLFKFLYFNKGFFNFPSLFFSISSVSVHKGGLLVIGKRAIISKETEILSKGILKIGSNFCLNKFSRIVAHESILIGNNVTIAQFVSILDHDHKFEMVNNEMVLNGYVTKKVSIGNNVWIGDKVTICKGVTIGNNVIIGANSVVTKNIEDNCIAVGNPCVKIKKI